MRHGRCGRPPPASARAPPSPRRAAPARGTASRARAAPSASRIPRRRSSPTTQLLRLRASMSAKPARASSGPTTTTCRARPRRTWLSRSVGDRLAGARARARRCAAGSAPATSRPGRVARAAPRVRSAAARADRSSSWKSRPRSRSITATIAPSPRPTQRDERREVEVRPDADAVGHGLAERVRAPERVEPGREDRDALRPCTVEVVREDSCGSRSKSDCSPRF